MRTHFRRTMAVAVAALALVSTGAFAQGKGHGHDKDNEREKEKGKRESETDGGRVRVESRGNVAIPPGLAKKPGHMPPGQYKKLYPAQGVTVLRDVFVRRGYTVVRTAPFGQSQYVYYRLPNGTMQRAIVSPGAQRLTFTNVPQALLQEVLARLY